MNQVANNLEKIIQENFSRLNLYNMGTGAQVNCSCAIMGATSSAMAVSPLTATSIGSLVAVPLTNVPPVKPDFTPGETNLGLLSTSDPGNLPFILPPGQTEESIVAEQAALLAPVVAEAEQIAQAEAATAAAEAAAETSATIPLASIAAPGLTTTVTKEATGETTVSVIASPTSTSPTFATTVTAPSGTGVSTATSTAPATVETFAPRETFASSETFAPIHHRHYRDLKSYRDLQSPHANDFQCPPEPLPTNPNLTSGSQYAAYNQFPLLAPAVPRSYLGATREQPQRSTIGELPSSCRWGENYAFFLYLCLVGVLGYLIWSRWMQ